MARAAYPSATAPPSGEGATLVSAPTVAPSTSTVAPAGADAPAGSTRPRSCRGTFPPRESMRATSYWPVKQPLVKLTARSMTS